MSHVLSEDAVRRAFQDEDPNAPTATYEYTLLVTNTYWGLDTLAQLYLERADSENPHDELKRQGWGGFMTKDFALPTCLIPPTAHSSNGRLVTASRARSGSAQRTNKLHQLAKSRATCNRSKSRLTPFGCTFGLSKLNDYK